MDKQKLNNKGTVLLEMIVVIMIVSMVLVINILVVKKSNINNIYLKERELLTITLNNARQFAINSRQLVSIEFNKHDLLVVNETGNNKYTFRSITFLTNKWLYYNKRGIINQGATILLKHGYQYRKIVFYLGKSWYKFE